MIKKVLLITLALTAVLAFEPGHSKESYIFARFQDFLTENNKKYSTIEEYMERFKIFKANYMRLESFAISPESKAKSYTQGINKFFDMTPQEFRRTYLNLKVSVLDVLRAKSSEFILTENKAPAAWDWREKGAVGKVKDQGSCGSCWAFSTVGNLEGLVNRKANSTQFIQFSEQQLVDCDKIDSGCNGGLMENAFKYIQQAEGLELSSDYKYTGREGNCHFDKTKAAVQVSGFEFAPSQDEEQIKEFLHTTGPLAIALNADPLQFYNGGIIDEDASSCDPEGLNHGVTLVGYGSDNGKDFWIVRNSWGTTWGEKGYFRIARGKGTCGVNTYVVTAKLK